MLRVAGLIESRREGRRSFYSLTDAGRAIVEVIRSVTGIEGR